MRYIELAGRRTYTAAADVERLRAGRRVCTAAADVERLSWHVGELVLLQLVTYNYLEDRASLRPKPLAFWQEQEVRAVEEEDEHD